MAGAGTGPHPNTTWGTSPAMERSWHNHPAEPGPHAAAKWAALYGARAREGPIFVHGRGEPTRFHLPLRFKGRDEVVREILQHGGVLESRLPRADVVLVEEGETYSGMQRDTAFATRAWVQDCIAKGTMLDLPTAAGLPAPPGALPGGAVAHSKRVSSSTNQNLSGSARRLRVEYNRTDEQSIVILLTALPEPWNVKAIARLLEAMHKRHSERSYQNHLARNLHDHSRYADQAEQRKKELGEVGLEELQAFLCQEYEAFAIFLTRVLARGEWRARKQNENDGRNQDSVRQMSPAGSSGRSATGRQDKGQQLTPRSALLEACQAISQMDDQSGQHTYPRADSPMTTAQERKFRSQHRDKLVEKLTEWMKSMFVRNSSSQGSVVGYLNAGQDNPQPPPILFAELASEIPCHSIAEWQQHFEKPGNKDSYLCIAHDRLECQLVEEEEQRRKAQESEQTEAVANSMTARPALAAEQTASAGATLEEEHAERENAKSSHREGTDSGSQGSALAIDSDSGPGRVSGSEASSAVGANDQTLAFDADADAAAVEEMDELADEGEEEGRTSGRAEEDVAAEERNEEEEELGQQQDETEVQAETATQGQIDERDRLQLSVERNQICHHAPSQDRASIEGVVAPPPGQSKRPHSLTPSRAGTPYVEILCAQANPYRWNEVAKSEAHLAQWKRRKTTASRRGTVREPDPFAGSCSSSAMSFDRKALKPTVAPKRSRLHTLADRYQVHWTVVQAYLKAVDGDYEMAERVLQVRR